MVITQRKMKQVAIFAICVLLVLGFYKTLVTTEEERSFNRGRHRAVLGVNKANLDKNELEVATQKIRDVEDDGDIRDIEEAKIRIRELEGKLQHLEAAIKNGVAKDFPTVKFLNYKNRKRILVTGGAGFVGSHLVDRLMLAGHEVIVVDNFFTGRKRNVEHWVGHENFELVHHDIVRPLYLEVDEIYHLASPASPPHYMLNPVKTIKTNTLGTINMLGLAKRVGARVLIASTSEVYGDPNEHPQAETYWGHVNPIGPRACYDEGKRVAETLSYAYMRHEGVSVRVARIFNTFGPRMHMNDGRVVSNFIIQALQNESITIYGSGKQTRSFQYVSDLVDGLVALMASNYTLPVNIGNPEEQTIEKFARIIKSLVGATSEIVELAAVEDDPQRRRPDISRAKKYLNWEPKVPLAEGLKKTIVYFAKELQRTKHSQKNSFKQSSYKNDHDIVEQL
ncbi:PREDICTED: UDP-glucuronic acid decarboxylase 1 [Trachymyrmex septentrionalis]|uniref:UDP-glucuronic acid decarboxylase 1 n=1 Tax=Trachymyrmex septentrionalis TaxID=34720 RepID=UPI00084F3707|nr:PREDICTED: UDP-glucuronic acid decarboxylase 1 [Trachymyrmex septentrionalis]XP_018373935.1 PREDICTED: UDP-glucuronic acid decarboxylase 1 [Trachymyrmex cornetzi]XP_018373936.1 PREDICTED: UDP-glucuronic acid decarboxylase 1 [Trachymyrmex cornetzi]XP_018373937.1 PREDICTED: UDP-glucuronic acid decarboxylase 1 [Trachymyrmex cornetzi]